MKRYKTVLLFSFIMFAFLFYKWNQVSDRIYPIENPLKEITIDTFEIYKRVKLKLHSWSKFDFNDKKICLLVEGDARTLVAFYGSYYDLTHNLIALPKPTCVNQFNEMKYSIGVHIYDFKKNLDYIWDSDGCVSIEEGYVNKIKLLYSGSEEETITLDVVQEKD